jgi:hypothetical protein
MENENRNHDNIIIDIDYENSTPSFNISNRITNNMKGGK